MPTLESVIKIGICDKLMKLVQLSTLSHHFLRDQVIKYKITREMSFVAYEMFIIMIAVKYDSGRFCVSSEAQQQHKRIPVTHN